MPGDDSRSVLSEASVRPEPDPADYQREILQLNDTGLERLRETLEKDLVSKPTLHFLINSTKLLLEIKESLISYL